MTSATPYPCVEVDWLDSQSDGTWRPLPEALREADADDLIHHSCGYLIADEPDYLLVAGSYRAARDNQREMGADLLQIPRPAVVALRELARPAP